MSASSSVLRPSSFILRRSSIRQALQTAATALASTDSPAVTAQALLGHVLGLSRAQVLARPEQELSSDQASAFAQLLARAAAGEPLAYLTGHREFCGLDFEVNPHVLVPRPETELIVELALRLAPPPRRIVDVGTGSGCLAVTLAVRLSAATVVATDQSRDALAVARRNAERHGVSDRITLLQTDLLNKIPEIDAEARSASASISGQFNLIVANLPYIDSEELKTLPVAAYEPLAALDGGPGGLVLVERLLGQAAPMLAPGGTVLLEIGAGQGQRAAALARTAIPQGQVSVYQDFAGLDRVVQIALPA